VVPPTVVSFDINSRASPIANIYLCPPALKSLCLRSFHAQRLAFERAGPDRPSPLVQLDHLSLEDITVDDPELLLSYFDPSTIKSLSVIALSAGFPRITGFLETKFGAARIAHYTSTIKASNDQKQAKYFFRSLGNLDRVSDIALLMDFIAQLPETASLKLHLNNCRLESMFAFPLWPVAKVQSLDINCFDHLDLFELTRVFPDLENLTLQFGFGLVMPLVRMIRTLATSGPVRFGKLRRLNLSILGFSTDSSLQQSIVGWLSSVIENAPLESLQLSVQSQNNCTLSISSSTIKEIDIWARSGSLLKVKLVNLPKLESLTISSNGVWTPHIADLVTISPIDVYLKSPPFLNHREVAAVHDRFGIEFLNRSSLCLAPFHSTQILFLSIFNIFQILSLYSQPFPRFGWTRFCPPAKSGHVSR
jgi:hypothetical protein